MSLEIIFFPKKKVLPNFAFSPFLSTFYLVSLMRGDIKHFFLFKEDAIERILGGKVWLYGFESVKKIE